MTATTANLRPFVAVLAVGLLVAACGDDDTDEDGDAGDDEELCQPDPVVCEEHVCMGDFTTADEAAAELLPSCTQITGDLTIFHPDGVALAGPPNCLKRVDGNVHVTQDLWGDGLRSLRSLASVGGSFEVGIETVENTMASIDGLASLTEIGGGFSIMDCPLLTDADGLCNLEHVGGGGIIIRRNDSLTNIDGLGAMQFDGYMLYVDWNSSLPNCDAVALQEQLGLTAENDMVCINANLSDECLDVWKDACDGTIYD